ncbi:hypothetical protein [Mesorhizobium mediterraneum]|uniref:hypothetical protein n=1 Tax=Mesorhizobium mediterraneum TaxID=43617 RepID=UPI0017831989|nr:hypothetical protein [Mesorhizobium mediterraneum]
MRFLFIALFMVLSTHVSAQEAQGVTTEAPSQQEGKSGKANDAQSSANEPSIPVRIIESPDETQHTRDREAASDKHESDDLQAQQKAADAADRAATAAERQVITAWWQVGVGIAGMAALLVTIWFSIRATNAAVAANKIAQEHFVAENRPWLSLGEPVFSIHSDDGSSPVVFVKVAVKNVGRSPALNVYLHVKTDPMAINFENSKSAERLAAEVAKPTAWRWGNVVIFPDNTEEITGVSDGVDNVTEKSRYLRVVICATCRGVTGDTVFHAASAYRFDAHILTELEGEMFEAVQATRIRGSNSIG